MCVKHFFLPTTVQNYNKQLNYGRETARRMLYFEIANWSLQVNDFSYKTTTESVNIKKLYRQTFINEQIRFMPQKYEVVFLSHRLGDLRVTYVLHLYLDGSRDRRPLR